jgi:hypothetical protein
MRMMVRNLRIKEISTQIPSKIFGGIYAAPTFTYTAYPFQASASLSRSEQKSPNTPPNSNIWSYNSFLLKTSGSQICTGKLLGKKWKWCSYLGI